MKIQRCIFVFMLMMLFVPVLSGCEAEEPQVITLAGGERGYADGMGAQAKFDSPFDLAIDGSGIIYVADAYNHRIRTIRDGQVATLAGTGGVYIIDGQGDQASFGVITGISYGQPGLVYIMDGETDGASTGVYVRTVTSDGETRTFAGSGLTTYRDGQKNVAAFRLPANLTVDKDGVIYIADTNNDRIRIVQTYGSVSTLAGSSLEGSVRGYVDGPSAEAKFNQPRGVAVDSKGNVFVADCGNHAIRMISATGWVSTLAGNGQAGYADGQGGEAQFNFPADIVIGPDGNLYVADMANHRIRMVTLDGVVTTVAGSGTPGLKDGPVLEAMFRSPEGIAVDASGVLYVADTGNNSIRQIKLK